MRKYKTHTNKSTKDACGSELSSDLRSLLSLFSTDDSFLSSPLRSVVDFKFIVSGKPELFLLKK